MARREARKLRELVNDYYHGLITLESYREQRAELLDNIGHYVEKAPDSATTAVDRKPVTPEVDDEFSPKPAGKSKLPLVAGVGVAIAAVAAGFYFLSIPDGEPGSASPAVGTEITVSDPGTAIIEEFLDRNDWSRDSIANFQIAWNALDDYQREDAFQQRVYRRLTTSLHQRIREEAALSTTPTPRFTSMTKFAEALGAPYRLAESAEAVGDMQVPSGSGPAEIPEREDSALHEEPTLESRTLPTEEETMERVAPESRTVLTEEETKERAAPLAVSSHPAVEAIAVDASSDTENNGPPESINDDCPASLASTRRPYCNDALKLGGEGPTLVVLNTGSFDMGSDEKTEESPVHRVTIGSPIAMSRDEISVAEFNRYCVAMDAPCPDNPWRTEDYPVVNVSWDDAVRYTDWLSEQTGHVYRLPTEAEWEYAARAGTTTPFFFGDEVTPSSARSSANTPNTMPLPVSERRVNRNPFRLYHMSGNVREWTLDAWYPSHAGAPADGSARMSDSASSRVVRGGSYSDPGERLRSAAREPFGQTQSDATTGIRVVREVAAASH
jgi:formylglycine-generating enzyme required for sulfatase activity